MSKVNCSFITLFLRSFFLYHSHFAHILYMSSADMFMALDKDMNGTLSKQELREYADGTLTDIFIERGMIHFNLLVNCQE